MDRCINARSDILSDVTILEVIGSLTYKGYKSKAHYVLVKSPLRLCKEKNRPAFM